MNKRIAKKILEGPRDGRYSKSQYARALKRPGYITRLRRYQAPVNVFGPFVPQAEFDERMRMLLVKGGMDPQKVHDMHDFSIVSMQQDFGPDVEVIEIPLGVKS